MATERFNQQFIMLDFEDLENPEFMAFVRSPEFSTYLIMRRYIWRSDKPHSMGLHQHYANGLLVCALTRERIAEALGGVTSRTVTKDINTLVKRGVIKAVVTGRQNIYVLGKWGLDDEEGIYYEFFFLDRLHSRMEENFQADSNSHPEDGRNLPGRAEQNFQGERKLSSDINRESNRERNTEPSNISKSPSSPSSSKDSPENGQYVELTSAELEIVTETCSREFGDMQHLESNLTRAFNLWGRTQLEDKEMIEKVREARRITKQRVSLSAIHDRGKKMAYFFAVLEDLLGLRSGP